MAGPTEVVNSATSVASTTLVWTPTGGAPPADHGLLLFMYYSGTAAPSAIPSGWTLVSSQTWAGGAATARLYRKLTGSSEPTSYTWTWAANQTVEATGHHISGCLVAADFLNVAQSYNTGAGPGGDITHSTVTTSLNNCLIVLSAANGSAADYGAPAGYTETYDGTQATASHATLVTAGAVGSKATTRTAGDNFAAWMVAISPSAPLALSAVAGVAAVSNLVVAAPALLVPSAVAGVAALNMLVVATPAPLVLSRVDGIAAANNLAVSSPALIVLGQVAGVAAVANLVVSSPSPLVLSQVNGIASLTELLIQANAYLTLGQVDGIAAVANLIVYTEALLALSQINGIASLNELVLTTDEPPVVSSEGSLIFKLAAGGRP